MRYVAAVVELDEGRTCLSDERITSVMQDVVQRALFNAG